MKNTKLSYLAGIIDGEGTVYIVPSSQKAWNRKEYRIRLQVGNTNKELLDWLKENFGGSVYSVKRKSHQNPRWKDKYEWFLGLSGKSGKLIKGIVPFAIIKKKHLELALKFIATFSHKKGTRLPDDIYNLREVYRLELKVLNKRGRQ